MKRTAETIHIEGLSPAKKRLFMVMLEKERARRKAAARSTLPLLSEDTPPLASLSQERLWFLQRLLPESCSYNIPAAVRMRGPLDVPALERSLERVLERQEVLRSRFKDIDDILVQIIDPPEKIQIPRRDLGEVPQDDRVQVIQQHALKQNTIPYDLETGPLLRSVLLCLGEDDHALVLNMHHTVTDGISVGLLVQEMAKIYAAIRRGEEPELPKLSVQYSDYSAWQRQEQTQEVLDERLDYWGQLVENMPPMLKLPTDRPRQAVQGSEGARHFLRIAPQLETRLGVLAARHKTTPFVTYLAILQVLLYRYSSQSEFLLGTAISGRNKPELEPLIGFFIDTVVLRADLTGAPSFVDLLARVRESATGALGHQDIGFEHLVEAFQDERDLSRHPLFQVAFSLQVAPMKTMRSAGLDMDPIDIDSGTSRMDLEIVLWDLEAGLAGLMEYDTDLFDEATIVHLEQHYQVLLRAVAENPETSIDDLPLMTPQEADQVLSDGRGEPTRPPQGYSFEVPIHQWIAKQAAERPRKTAIVAGERRWTYETLERRANQLARRLAQLGVGPEKIVAVLLERSPELIMSELAVLKAGAAFVPLDPGFPESRLKLLLASSAASVVVTDSSRRSRLDTWKGQILWLDQEELGTIDDSPMSVSVTPQHRAFVIFTSGSTGQPKGIEIEHRGLLNFVFWYRQLVSLTPEDRGSQIASPTFDASVMEIWPFLSAGTTIYIPDAETRVDPLRLRDWFVEN